MCVVACGLLLTACSSHPEQPILQQFFTASRLRDNQTLANFATVSFNPQTDGAVTSFSITSVSPVQTKPLPLKDLAQVRDQAKADDDAFTKKKLDYQNANLDAIQRVLKAEQSNGKVTRKDEAVQAAWDKWRQDTETSAKKVSDAQQALSDAAGIAQISVNASRPNSPLNVTQYNGTLALKEVTVSAKVQTPDGSSQQKNLIVTMEQVTLDAANNGQPLEGRWVVTGVKAGA
jgi:hypothetical protein